MTQQAMSPETFYDTVESILSAGQRDPSSLTLRHTKPSLTCWNIASPRSPLANRHAQSKGRIARPGA